MSAQRNPIKSLDGISLAKQPSKKAPAKRVYLQPASGKPTAGAAKPHQPLYFTPRDTEVVVNLPRNRRLRARLSSVLQYTAIAAIALIAAYSTGIGQWFVLAYAVYAISLRRSSSLSFGIALFVLVFIPFFQLLNQPGVANNMAVYVYELLVVGTVQAIIELRWPARSSS